MWLFAVSSIRTTCRTRLPVSSRTLSCRRHAIWIDCQLPGTTDHLSIEIALYFRILGQSFLDHNVEDHSTNHWGWAHGFRLCRNFIWWIKLALPFIYTICGRSRGHHRHIGDLGNFSHTHGYKRAGRKSKRHIIHQYQVTVAASYCAIRAATIATSSDTNGVVQVTENAPSSLDIRNVHLIVIDCGDKYSSWQWSTQLDAGWGNVIWCRTRILGYCELEFFPTSGAGLC